MKNKIDNELKNKDGLEPLEEKDTIEDAGEVIDVRGPDVASKRGSKFALIGASAALIAVVLYLLFFSSDKPAEKKIVATAINQDQDFSGDAPANAVDLSDFNNLLNEDKNKKKDNAKEDVITETPDVPPVPTLPDIFSKDKDDKLPDFLDLPEKKKEEEKGPVDITKLTETDNQNNQQQNQNQNNQNNNSNQDNNQNQNGNSQNNQNQNNNSSLDNQNSQPKQEIAPLIVVAGSGPSSSIGESDNIINPNKKNDKPIEESVPKISAQYISDRSTTLIQGKILTAILETAINTEFPGEVRGIISRDVYAEAGSNVLIPRGSRIYGNYSSKVVRGQARVTINWTRLIRPDGVDATIAFNASDQFGRAGIEGSVDNKYASLITNSILTSVLAVGGAIAAERLSGNKQNTTVTNPTSGTTTQTSNASSQAIYDVSKTIIDTVGDVIGNTIDMNPVIRVPQGTKITIVVNSDMSLPQFKK